MVPSASFFAAHPTFYRRLLACLPSWRWRVSAVLGRPLLMAPCRPTQKWSTPRQPPAQYMLAGERNCLEKGTCRKAIIDAYSGPCTRRDTFAEYVQTRSRSECVSLRQDPSGEGCAGIGNGERPRSPRSSSRAPPLTGTVSRSRGASHQGINPLCVEEAKFSPCIMPAAFSCVECFFFRTGRTGAIAPIVPQIRSLSLSARRGARRVCCAILETMPCPRCIFPRRIEDRALLAEALSHQYLPQVEVNVPQRGEEEGSRRSALANAPSVGDAACRDLLPRQAARVCWPRLLRLPRPPAASMSMTTATSRAATPSAPWIVSGASVFQKEPTAVQYPAATGACTFVHDAGGG